MLPPPSPKNSPETGHQETQDLYESSQAQVPGRVSSQSLERGDSSEEEWEPGLDIEDDEFQDAKSKREDVGSTVLPDTNSSPSRNQTSPPPLAAGAGIRGGSLPVPRSVGGGRAPPRGRPGRGAPPLPSTAQTRPLTNAQARPPVRNLLSEVTNFEKAKLKKRRQLPSSPRNSRKVDARGGLLAAIRSGSKLKKVDPQKLEAERAEKKKSGGGIGGSMASSIAAIMARRGQIAGANSDTDDDSDWSDGD